MTKEPSMPISFSCLQCGKKLKAPDNAAGKSSKCPGCGATVTCPEPIYDAELVETSDAVPGGIDPYGDLDADKPYAMTDAAPATATATEDRRPCPMCGEMIMAAAAKCRYCGEVFDPTIKKLKKGSKGGKAKLASMASAQRNLIICILLEIILYIGLLAIARGQNPEPGLAILILCMAAALIGVAIAAMIYTFKLAIQIHNTGVGILLGILTLVPCIGLMVLLTINSSATRILRDNGHHVGFLGADMSEF
jgi:predicted RNA-binding Zn-ribbon protein involved in translation (DUF1610 family)